MMTMSSSVKNICRASAVVLALASTTTMTLPACAGALVSAQEISVLAKQGQMLIRQDPRAVELLRRQGEHAGQFGFDVGMGVAKGNTLPGPGKDNVGSKLSPAEKQGFDIAVAYSLERNSNAHLAAVGAKIARVDPDVQEARTADRDVFYWLGFDVATGTSLVIPRSARWAIRQPDPAHSKSATPSMPWRRGASTTP
jgi:hypothetical protein